MSPLCCTPAPPPLGLCMQDITSTPTLLEKTRELLKTSGCTYLKIYSETGLEPTWISGVCTGRIKDPSVNRVQKLYEYLAGSKLAI